MEWKYVKKLTSESAVEDFENAVGFRFPDDFKKCVKENNGGRPALKSFMTAANNERVLKSFLSFNKEDRETVWKINEWNEDVLNGRYAAFAIDNFGNLICFDKSNSGIVFLDCESGAAEAVSGSFAEFFQNLYE